MAIRPTLIYCILRLIIAVSCIVVDAVQPQQWALLRRNRINAIGPKELSGVCVCVCGDVWPLMHNGSIR